MTERIPLRGATQDQIECVRLRLVEMFPPQPEQEQEPPRAPRLSEEQYLHRLGPLGDTVWFWDEHRKARAAIVTFVHAPHLGGRLDLAVFTPLGGMEVRLNVQRGRNLGWTPRGSLT